MCGLLTRRDCSYVKNGTVRFMQLQYQGTVHVKNNINKVGQSLLNFLYDLAQNDIMWLQLLLKLDFQQTEKIVC